MNKTQIRDLRYILFRLFCLSSEMIDSNIKPAYIIVTFQFNPNKEVTSPPQLKLYMKNSETLCNKFFLFDYIPSKKQDYFLELVQLAYSHNILGFIEESGARHSRLRRDIYEKYSTLDVGFLYFDYQDQSKNIYTVNFCIGNSYSPIEKSKLYDLSDSMRIGTLKLLKENSVQ